MCASFQSDPICPGKVAPYRNNVNDHLLPRTPSDPQNTTWPQADRTEYEKINEPQRTHNNHEKFQKKIQVFPVFRGHSSFGVHRSAFRRFFAKAWHQRTRARFIKGDGKPATRELQRADTFWRQNPTPISNNN